MYLQRLELHNFRNIRVGQIAPVPGFNILWGDNAQGKTNILEGIYLLGSLKSFRGARNEELILQGADRSAVRCELSWRGSCRRIGLVISGEGKTASLDGKEIRTAGDYSGLFRPVLFSPEEVGLVKGSPAGRRALLDRAVFQTDAGFLDLSRTYQRCLRQRNRLLREGRTEGEILPWTEGLVSSGARIRRDRNRYLQHLSTLFREAYRNLAGGGEVADLLYPQGGDDEKLLEETLRRELAGQAARERQLGQTLAGPHRDDPRFLVDGRPARLFASQGQQRSVMLAFKTAQIMDLEARLGETPVLLLDDMTSELDRRRQGFFFRFLLGRQGQVFITTTEIQPLLREGIRSARFFRVREGKLTEENNDLRTK